MPLKKLLSRALLHLYKRHKRRRADLSTDHCLAVARQIVRTTPYCFLISHGLPGWPSARLVEPIADLDTFVFWIGTDPKLRKAAEVSADPRVTLAFGNMKQQANLVVYGTAALVTDAPTKQRFWKGSWRLFFPDGPRSDGYVAIRVEAQRMELMSFGQNVVAEPFGLRPVVLAPEGGRWRVEG
jgi:general stress protein 26